jgi:(2Fe-2S) ferredoxin
MPIRERYVWVCGNRRPDGEPRGSCAQKGSEALRDQLKVACSQAGLLKRVRVMTSSCLDVCEHGIAMAVMPDNILLSNVQSDDVATLVETLKTPNATASHPAFVDRVIKNQP